MFYLCLFIYLLLPFLCSLLYFDGNVYNPVQVQVVKKSKKTQEHSRFMKPNVFKSTKHDMINTLDTNKIQKRLNIFEFDFRPFCKSNIVFVFNVFGCGCPKFSSVG